MTTKTTVLELGPLPVTLSTYERELLTLVNESLTMRKRTLALVEMGEDNAPLMSACVDRLLRSNPGSRILVLVGNASLKTSVVQALAKVIPPDGVDGPTAWGHLRAGNDLRVCVSTLREMQVLVPRPVDEEEHTLKHIVPTWIGSDTFDEIVLYGSPTFHAFPLWQHLLCYFEEARILGFFEMLHPSFLPFFDWNVVCRRHLEEIIRREVHTLRAEHVS